MNDIKSYQCDNILKRSKNKVVHGFFTRLCGVSQGVYHGLNCGHGSGDNTDHTSENRGKVANETGVQNNALLSLYQVHGPDVFYVTETWSQENRPKADAMVTDKTGFALGILTADCAPVLFYGQKENGEAVIGAAHAGWKGALSGVLENTVTEMERLGAQKETIAACVGPCISKSSYEVSDDFIEPFIKENEESERFFHAGLKSGSAYFDLSGYCGWRLSRAGLKTVSLMDRDTYSNPDEFYSYRRMTHNSESDYGRQISVITIKE